MADENNQQPQAVENEAAAAPQDGNAGGYQGGGDSRPAHGADTAALHYRGLPAEGQTPGPYRQQDRPPEGHTHIVARGGRGERELRVQGKGQGREPGEPVRVGQRSDQVADQFIDLNENGVLVIFRVHARGRTSGVELAQRLAVHWTFKDGKPWRGVGYSDVDEARRAVGLA